MKPLVVIALVLVAAGSVDAQGIADAARKERARQAQTASTRVFTDANAHSLEPVPARPVPVTPAPATAAPAISAKSPIPSTVVSAAPGSPAAVPAEDEQVRKLRAKVRELENQETALKLQINDVTNQVYAPVTDQASLNDALARLGIAQTKLADTQKDLAQARGELQKKDAEAQTTPKK